MTTYISCDIETNGTTPGLHSMLSLGAAAYDENAKPLGTWSGNFLPLLGTSPHLGTEKWWKKHPAALIRATEGAVDAKEATVGFYTWAMSFPKQQICICWPAAWDYAFIYHYLMRFVGVSPFGHSALDIKTLAFAVTGEFRSKRELPKETLELLTRREHTHIALDDAIEQAEIFFSLLKLNRL